MNLLFFATAGLLPLSLCENTGRGVTLYTTKRVIRIRLIQTNIWERCICMWELTFLQNFYMIKTGQKWDAWRLSILYWTVTEQRKTKTKTSCRNVSKEVKHRSPSSHFKAAITGLHCSWNDFHVGCITAQLQKKRMPHSLHVWVDTEAGKEGMGYVLCGKGKMLISVLSCWGRWRILF